MVGYWLARRLLARRQCNDVRHGHFVRNCRLEGTAQFGNLAQPDLRRIETDRPSLRLRQRLAAIACANRWPRSVDGAARAIEKLARKIEPVLRGCIMQADRA